MSSYINQAVARDHIAGLVAEAERHQLRRDLRRARRRSRGPDAVTASSEAGPSRVRRRTSIAWLPAWLASTTET